MTIQQLVNAVTGGQFDDKFRELYGNSEREIMKQRARYINAAEHFSRAYPECDDIRIFSSPVCVNISDESTYHQGGCVLSAAATIDIIAVTGLNEDGVIRIDSQNFPCCEINVDGGLTNEDKKSPYVEIVRGVISAFVGKNVSADGINAYISSDISPDTGFSAAAAFENLIGIIINNYYNNDASSAKEIAMSSPNVNIDMIVGAAGGLVSAEFDGNAPIIKAVDYDFSSLGYSVCITVAGGDDSENYDDPDEMTCGMKETAEYFGKSLLRDVDEDEFYDELPKMRKCCSDAAILSAIRFFEENRRATDAVKALEIGDTEEFFRLVDQSGKYTVNRVAAAVAAISRRFLGESGMIRVCDGGIVQAFVPSYIAADYVEKIDSFLGEERCRMLGIRSKGVTEIIFN